MLIIRSRARCLGRLHRGNSLRAFLIDAGLLRRLRDPEIVRTAGKQKKRYYWENKKIWPMGAPPQNYPGPIQSETGSSGDCLGLGIWPKPQIMR